MKSIRDLGEDALIRQLLAEVPVAEGAAGPGDDCAVIDGGGESLQLLKTDAIVEGIHWEPGADALRVGWKAAARVISDFAAMGGHPREFLVTLALPATTPVDWLSNLYRGIGRCLQAHGAKIAGGETSRCPEGSAIFISVAATGEVRREHLTLRSGAKPGDVLLVTGRLGGSIGGRHLDFSPRLAEAGWLVSHFKPTAMMDLSDGLAKDLPRLAEASRCGLRLDRNAVPCSDGCGIAQALHDGEDYELLFAIEAGRVPALLAAWPPRFADTPLTVIGELCVRGEGDQLEGGWDHFS